jgi:hypothetical protein
MGKRIKGVARSLVIGFGRVKVAAIYLLLVGSERKQISY